MSLALYGKDFLGRSVIRGYGNIHLPTAEGRHRRTLRTFQPIPISSIATCCAFLHGYINEYVGYEKVLTDPEQQLR